MLTRQGMLRVFLIACVPLNLFACGSLAAAEQTLSYVDLVSRLTDLKRLAVVPEAGEQCAQWSSYDRRSRYDAPTDTYIAWDAKGDGDGIVRKECGKLVSNDRDLLDLCKPFGIRICTPLQLLMVVRGRTGL